MPRSEGAVNLAADQAAGVEGPGYGQQGGRNAGTRQRGPRQGPRPQMDGALRSQVILAAVGAVNAEGPSDAPYEERVAAAALRIAAMLGEDSLVSRALDSLERCDTFVATPVNGRLEESSQRRIVFFESPDRTTGEERVEELRTERADDPLGRLVYAQARACKGQRVRVYKEIEDTGKMKDGHPVKVRMLRWVEPV